MKIHRRAPYGELCGDRIQMHPKLVWIRPQGSPSWDGFVSLLWTGDMSNPTGWGEYELRGFDDEVRVVVPRDKLIRNL